MVTLAEMPVAKRGGRGGRPRAGLEAGTRHVRVNEDLAEMVGWIVRIRGGSSAQLLDPLLRAALSAVYKQIEPDVDRIKAAEQAVRAAEEAAARRAAESPRRKPTDRKG